MWEAAEKKAEKKKRLRQDAPLLSAENAPLEEREQTDGPRLSFEDMRISYFPASSPAGEMPEPGVIQLKQTTPLEKRLREQGITPGSLGDEIEKFIRLYDGLANDASTRVSQQNYLYLLLDRLHANRTSEASGRDIPAIRTALRIVQDELHFVSAQRFDGPLVSPMGAWEHMDSSPFLKMIGDMTRMEQQGPPASTAPPAPIRGMPPSGHFSARAAVSALSRHHINALETPGTIPVPALKKIEKIKQGFRSLLGQPAPTEQQRTENTFASICSKISGLLLRSGMLSHYSHKPDLAVLHSTDYLKANQILSRERVEKGTPVGENENVSKSMSVDTDDFKNTGFLFFFLERQGSSHRGGTGFGKYRYTVPLGENLAILDNAWAILHDMAGASSSNRSIRKSSPVKRVIEGPPDLGERFMEWQAAFQGSSASSQPSALSQASASSQSSASPQASASSQASASELKRMLSLFLPTADQKFALQTPDGKTHATGIEDHISGNFLQGCDIINGIALRAAHELMALRNCSAEDYEALMGNEDALWEYVAGIIHDMQIMVPNDVLPQQYDFEEDGELHSRDTGTAGGPAHISDPKELEQLLRPDKDPRINNCFFQAMFPLIDHEGLHVGDAVGLRRLFNERLGNAAGLPDGEPAEYQHVQQFANTFHISITVIAIDTAGNPVMIDFAPQDGHSDNHVYIRFLAPPSEDGVGHYTNL